MKYSLSASYVCPLSHSPFRGRIVRFKRSPFYCFRCSSLTIALTLFISCVAFLIGGSIEAKNRKKGKKKVHTLAAAQPISTPLLPALSKTQSEALSQIRTDPPPPEIVRNSHYWVSNEHNHQLWMPYIKEIGGVMLGVGTDQNYLLAGWAKPKVLFLMDFDGQIPILHEIYQHLFSISENPKDFLSRWHKKYAEDTFNKLNDHFKQQALEHYSEELNDKKKARKVKRWVKTRTKIYKITRSLLFRRLSKTLKKYNNLNIPIFLSDQSQYDYLRSLWERGRVIAIRGDLTADKTMIDIAQALKTMGMTLNVLYLSNAEQYFDLIPTYRRNIITQPWGEKSFALRTLGWGGLGFVDEKEEYHYNIQSGLNMAEWMEKSRTSKAGRMLRLRTKTKVKGFSVLTRSPPASKRGPKIAPIPN